MLVKQFVLEGLGNSSYLIASQKAKVGAVIDPQRDVDIYLKAAEELGIRITHVLETHLHADFVSGSRELSAQTGAVIAASAAAGLQFEHLPLKEGDRIELGELVIQVMETPGHSPEHISFLVRETEGHETPALFSGGALIPGGAARTDLLGHEHTHPLTHQLYHTLHRKLMPLPDETEVFPTHGAGSFCAATAERRRTTTVGWERQHNPLVRASSEEEFVKLALEGLSSYPTYFTRMRPLNQKGPPLLGELPKLRPLPPQEGVRRIQQGAMVVDARPPTEFALGHIPQSIHIPLRDTFVSWLGWVVPPDRPLVFVVNDSQSLEEIVRQAIRIGYDDLAGYLQGSLKAWKEAGYPVATSELTTIDEVHRHLQEKMDGIVLDVRQDAEWREGHIPGAIHIELGELADRASELPQGPPIAITCSLGQRSSTGVSLLQRHGFPQVKSMTGGMTAWRQARLPEQKE